eukprot:5165045-Prymnesium_polylepis.1
MFVCRVLVARQHTHTDGLKRLVTAVTAAPSCKVILLGLVKVLVLDPMHTADGGARDLGGRKTEDGRRRKTDPDGSGRKRTGEDGRRKTGQKTEDGGRKTEGGRRKTEARKDGSAEDGRQKRGRRKTED